MRTPVEALHLIGENHARNGVIGRERHLEGIALDSRGDGAQKREAAFLVIASRADDQRGAAADLIGARAVITQALDDRARNFYQRFGFRAFSDKEPLMLLLGISELRVAIGG